jgi:AraC family transcriptional regulator of adaptative response / DNA-3-methyladenine glycosylase II
MARAVVDARPGLRVPGGWDAFEVATRAILGQQVSLEHGRMLVSRLAESAGAPYAGPAGPPELTLVFPTAARVLGSRTVLDGMPASRRAALIALSQQLHAHPTQLAAWRDPRLVDEELGRVPGIGPWTGAYIRLRALRDPDAFPVTDVGLLRALANQAGRSVSAREALTRSEAWRPWRAYAAQHLWTAAGTPHRTARARGRREAVA